jgi:hypothetical protein
VKRGQLSTSPVWCHRLAEHDRVAQLHTCDRAHHTRIQRRENVIKPTVRYRNRSDLLKKLDQPSEQVLVSFQQMGLRSRYGVSTMTVFESV